MSSATNTTTNNTTEKSIEQRLVRAVKSAGGLAIKLTSGGGLPDRLLLFPPVTPGGEGRAVFVETKAPHQKPRLLQTIRHEELRKLGFDVYVVDSIAGVDEVVEKYGKEDT